MTKQHPTRVIVWACAAALALMYPTAATAQEAVEVDVATEQEEVAAELRVVQVAAVHHVNHSLVLFDEHERRFVIQDGVYASEEGVVLVIRDGRIQRFTGCGNEPCDFTIHATRVVDRRLLVYAELALPDGRYRNDGGTWFKMDDGELVEYYGEGPG